MYFRIEGAHSISLVDVKSGKDEAKLGEESLDWVLIVKAAGMKESTWEHNTRQRLTDKIGMAIF